MTVLAGGAAFAAVEPHQTTGEGIYWAITTMTTVGYGDLSPTTTKGKMLAAVVILVGVGFVAILTGAVAERFLASEVEREAVEVEEELDATGEALLRELQGVRARLDRMDASVRSRRAFT